MKTRTPLPMAPAISQDHQGAAFFLRRTCIGVGWATSGSEGVSVVTALGGAGAGAGAVAEGEGGVGAAVAGPDGWAGAGDGAGAGAGAGAAEGAGAGDGTGTGAGAGFVGADAPRAVSAATLPVLRSTADSMGSLDSAPFSA